MKALSVKQPWATMIAEGEKTIETRTWDTDYRGDLIICSSKQPKVTGHLAGFALCVVELYDVRPLKPADEDRARCRYFPGGYAWCLRNLRDIIPKVPVRGQLGIFELEFKDSIRMVRK